MSAVESRRITTKVGSIHVEVRGEGAAVVCWPSLYCDARSVDGVAEDLSRDHRVVVIEGPGHGRSGNGPESFSFDDCVAAAGIDFSGPS